VVQSSRAGSADPIDFASLAAALLERAHLLVPQWLPGGVQRGAEWVCGDLTGAPGSSLSVNLSTGRWADFSHDEDKGGDLVSLYAAAHNLNQGQAARELMRQLGWASEWSQDRPAEASAAAQEPVARAAASSEPLPASAPAAAPPEAVGKRWQAVVPVPTHVQPPRRFLWGFRNERTQDWVRLEASRVWEYRFEGRLYGYVGRFERFDSDGVLVKDTIPFTFCRDLAHPRGTMEWRHRTWEAPRPLYVPATLLAADSRLVPVVVVEGEKCAQALHELLGHEVDAVCWPGGARAWPAASWSWLKGRVVILWPDCDAKRVRLTKAEREAGVDASTKPLLPEDKQPGMQAMVGIGSLLMAEHGCQVSLCAIPQPGEVPDGWDVADAIQEGWDAARVRDFIRAARAFTPPGVATRAAAGAAAGTSGRSGAAAGDGGSAGAGAGGAGGGGGGGGAADDEDESWRRYLLTDQKGAVKAVRENIVIALDGRPDRKVGGIPGCERLIRFNDFSNNVEKVGPTPWGTPAGDWLEADELQLGDWLVREHRMPSMSRQALEEAVLIVSRRHAHHPVREQMVARRGTWDQQPRLDTWLRRCMLEEDEWDDRDPLQQYLALAGRWFLMGMVARVMPLKREGTRTLVGPGVKFDYMLVLEGPQGWGKSTVAATLGGDYFSDSALAIGDKDSYQNIQGILIYEWGELENMSKAEVTKVKLFISSPSDRFRATFDRRPAKYPRQVVFVGTTNESHDLTDTTGNRRFWPVRVTRPPDVEWLREHLEQLLAEAVHRVDAGERFWPDRDEQRRLFDPQQAARTVESSLEAAIRTYLYDENQKVPHGGSNGALVNSIGLSELLTRVGYTIDKQTDVVVKKAGAVMHMLGWVVKRTSLPGRPRVYVRPGTAGGNGSASGAAAGSGDDGPAPGPDDTEDPHGPPF
jgi:predicted P-loop ATPase